MKRKILSLLTIAVVTVFALAGCKKNTVYKDADGCFLNINQAMEDAQKNNRNILVMLTVEGNDIESENFLNNVVRSEDFKDKIASKYTVMHIDLSDATYEKTVARTGASKEEEKEAAINEQLWNDGIYLANMLMPEYTPTFFLLTKDEYVLTEIVPEGMLPDVASFEEAIAQYTNVISEIEEIVERTKKGSDEEMIKAIDELFEGTYPGYRVFLADLVQKVLKLDKTNKSGLLSKYILADAENSALVAYNEADIDTAVSAYLNICSNQYLEPADKQQAYYMAAYFRMFSGSENIGEISQYLNYAIQAYPEGPDVPAIQETLDAISNSYYQY